MEPLKSMVGSDVFPIEFAPFWGHSFVLEGCRRTQPGKLTNRWPEYPHARCSEQTSSSQSESIFQPAMLTSVRFLVSNHQTPTYRADDSRESDEYSTNLIGKTRQTNVFSMFRMLSNLNTHQKQPSIAAKL